MNNEKLLQRKSAVYQMGLLFNQAPSDEKITAYANALMNYEPSQITFAFKQVILSGSAFFPSLAEILKHLMPIEEAKQDKAPLIASEMLTAIRTYGPHAEVKMLEEISEDARLTFLALGHTGDIRNSENVDTVRAQLERLARGVLASKEAATKNESLEKLGIVKGAKILEMKKPEAKKLDYSEFIPEKA